MTTVGFYVKAGVKTGYGHIIRCIALATELKRRGHECYFLGNKDATDRAAQSGFAGNEFMPDCQDAGTYFPGGDILIIDLEGGCPPRYAIAAKQACEKLVVLAGVGYPDGDPGRLLADLVFYQGVTDRPATLDWTGFNGRWFVGPEYLILRDEFRELLHHESHDGPRVVIAGGGSDPKHVTERAIDALEKDSIDCRAIIGPANTSCGANRGWLTTGPMVVEYIHNPDDMSESLAWADVAVISYGMTAFECLALGIPTVALSISPDHKASADLVQQQSGGALLSLGEVDDVTPEQIRLAVYSQLARQATLSKQARAFVNGQGAERVAGLILESKK